MYSVYLTCKNYKVTLVEKNLDLICTIYDLLNIKFQLVMLQLVCNW